MTATPVSPLPRGQIPLATTKPSISLDGVRDQVAEIASRSIAGVGGGGEVQLSMVVVAYREADSLIRVLRTLADSCGTDDELILVDNGLDPQVAAQARSLVFTYVRCRSNLGCSQGRNVGAAVARGKLLAFVDADAEIGAEYVQACRTAMASSSRVAVRGRVLPLREGAQMPTHYDLGTEAAPTPISAEGASVWQAELFRKAGGFEAALYGREGPVLCYRMHLLFGVPTDAFWYDPAILLRHDYGTSASHLWQKLKRNARLIDQVDRGYPMMRSYLSGFRTLRGARTASLAVKARAQAARWQVQLATELAALTDPAGGPEISGWSYVVCDGGDTRPTETTLRRQTVRVARWAGDGGGNAGDDTWLLFVANGICPHPTLIERMIRATCQHPTATAVSIGDGREVTALRGPWPHSVTDLARSAAARADEVAIRGRHGVGLVLPGAERFVTSSRRAVVATVGRWLDRLGGAG